MSFQLAEQNATQIPLVLTIDAEGIGGVTGLSPTVALRDATTLNSYLDFADNTFKAVGWTTQYQTLSEVQRGHYQYLLDASAVSAIAAGTVLAVEYHVNAGNVVGDDHDLLYFVESLNALAASGDPMDLLPATIVSLVDDIWDEPVAGHQIAGTFGVATNQVSVATTALIGSTSTLILTGLTQVTGFYDGMMVTVVNALGTATRQISAYSSVSGALTVDALPFVPLVGDLVLIHRMYLTTTSGGGGVSAAAIADAVWDELLLDHQTSGSMGEALALAASGGGGGTGDIIIIPGGVLLNFEGFSATVNNPSTGTDVDRRIDLTASPETQGSGKIYIETDLSVIYIAFGGPSVDAGINSIRLVGGAPWVVATQGFSHVSVFAAANIPITIWGLIGVPSS